MMPKEPEDNRIKVEANETDWITNQKFERWMIIEGIRPQHEYSDKTIVSKPPKISKRLNLIMEKLIMNIMKRQAITQQHPNPKPSKKAYQFKKGFVEYSTMKTE